MLFPETLETIGARAFADSDTLYVAEFASEATLGADVFQNCPELTLLAPGGGNLETYAAAYEIPFIALEGFEEDG